MKPYRRKFLLLAAIVILIVAVLFYALLIHNKDDKKYTYIEGTVTAYDATPSYVDGGIIFRIDNTNVDIGGGLRPVGNESDGSVYSPIKIGDKVKAKVVRPEPEYYTVYSCSECYVKKQ